MQTMIRHLVVIESFYHFATVLLFFHELDRYARIRQRSYWVVSIQPSCMPTTHRQHRCALFQSVLPRHFHPIEDAPNRHIGIQPFNLSFWP